jgi:hypothetical protein
MLIPQDAVDKVHAVLNASDKFDYAADIQVPLPGFKSPWCEAATICKQNLWQVPYGIHFIVLEDEANDSINIRGVAVVTKPSAEYCNEHNERKGEDTRMILIMNGGMGAIKGLIYTKPHPKEKRPYLFVTLEANIFTLADGNAEMQRFANQIIWSLQSQVSVEEKETADYENKSVGKF